MASKRTKYDARISEMTTTAPLYAHDCKACKWLGSIAFDAPLLGGDKVRKRADLYVCKGSISDKTVIARLSSEPPDYASSDVAVFERSLDHYEYEPSTHGPALLEAYRRSMR